MPNLPPQVQYPVKPDPQFLRLLFVSLLLRLKRGSHRPPRRPLAPAPLFQEQQ